MKKHSLLFEQIGKHNISFLLPPKKHSVCALCCWSLCFGFAICFWNFQKQNQFLQTILQQELFSCSLLSFLKNKQRLCAYLLKNSFLLLFLPLFSHLLLTIVRSVVAVTRTSAAGHPLHQFFCHSFHFFQSFLFFYFVMLMCFSLYLFDSPLFVISLCFPLFCLPSFFNKKSLLVFFSSFSICSCSFSFSMSSSFFRPLLFHSKKLVTPFVCLFFSILFFF